ncbi:MAG: hypothetical protein LBT34_03385 [Clostridiales Family XIII bacterium]|jgi:hypothetical protein|nr:hypothetical protein [Clostridiales Family XIII bacterium]
MSGSIHADGISGAVSDFGAEELNPRELLFPEEQLAAAGVAGAEYYSPTILAYE